MMFDRLPNRSAYEHEILPEILDEVIPEVVRERILATHDAFDEVDPESISDEEILDAVEWDGTPKRGRKWMRMSGEVVLRADMSRQKSSMVGKREGTAHDYGIDALSAGATDIDWMTCYNESADAVAIYIDGISCAETVKSALLRETFGGENLEPSISIEVPREVLRRLEQQVRDRDDVSVGGVISAHRDAIDRAG